MSVLEIVVVDHLGRDAGAIHSTAYRHRRDHSEASVLGEWRRQAAITDLYAWQYEHGRRAARLELRRDGLIMEIKYEPHAW